LQAPKVIAWCGLHGRYQYIYFVNLYLRPQTNRHQFRRIASPTIARKVKSSLNKHQKGRSNHWDNLETRRLQRKRNTTSQKFSVAYLRIRWYNSILELDHSKGCTELLVYYDSNSWNSWIESCGGQYSGIPLDSTAEHGSSTSYFLSPFTLRIILFGSQH
jgi:hypothetical protein